VEPALGSCPTVTGEQCSSSWDNNDPWSLHQDLQQQEQEQEWQQQQQQQHEFQEGQEQQYIGRHDACGEKASGNDNESCSDCEQGSPSPEARGRRDLPPPPPPPPQPVQRGASSVRGRSGAREVHESAGRTNGPIIPDTTTLLVKGLPTSMKEEELRACFDKEEIDAARITVCIDTDTGCCKGYAFADLVEPKHAIYACRVLGGVEIDGRPLHVEVFSPCGVSRAGFNARGGNNSGKVTALWGKGLTPAWGPYGMGKYGPDMYGGMPMVMEKGDYLRGCASYDNSSEGPWKGKGGYSGFPPPPKDRDIGTSGRQSTGGVERDRDRGGDRSAGERGGSVGDRSGSDRRPIGSAIGAAPAGIQSGNDKEPGSGHNNRHDSDHADSTNHPTSPGSLFVGGLSFRAEEPDIRKLFERNDLEIERVTIAVDRETGKSKGFAFIDLQDPRQAERAVRALHNQELCGRAITVQLKGGERDRGGNTASSSAPAPRPSEQVVAETNSTRIFVGGIAFQATNEVLKAKFEEAGEVVSARIVLDKETGKPKGFGFVEYATSQDAVKALRKLQGAEICGRAVRLDLPTASNKESNAQAGTAAPARRGPKFGGLSADRRKELFGDLSKSRSPSRTKKRSKSRSRSRQRQKSRPKKQSHSRSNKRSSSSSS